MRERRTPRDLVSLWLSGLCPLAKHEPQPHGISHRNRTVSQMASSVLIASINKGYSLRISRVEFSQAFQPEVFPARDRVWVLKQAKRERDKRREIEASIEPNTPQLEMLEWVASDPGRLSHSVHVKLVASAKRKQNNCSLRVTYDNTRLPIFSLLSVLRPFLTGGTGKFCSPTIASSDSPRNRFPNRLDDILSFFYR